MTERRTADQEAARVYRRLLEEGPRVMYCLRGSTSGELLTRLGRLIVHDDHLELDHVVAGATVIAVPPSAGTQFEDFVPYAALADNAAMLWPLDPTDFRADGDGNAAPPADRLTVPNQGETHARA
jgi:hypothetical protein